MTKQACELCSGNKLKQASLSVYINDKNISSICKLSITDLKIFFKNLKLNKTQQKISLEIIKEIMSRLEFLNNVGLGYLNLNRNFLFNPKISDIIFITS